VPCTRDEVVRLRHDILCFQIFTACSSVKVYAQNSSALWLLTEISSKITAFRSCKLCKY